MSDASTSSNRITLAEWREKELTYVIGALATALELEDDEQRDALCDIREWAKNRLKAQLPDETTELHPTSEADKLLDAAEITIRLCKGSCSKDIQRRIKGYLNAKFPGHIVSLSVEPTPDRLAQSTWTCEHCARVNDTDTTFNRCPFCDEFRKGYAEKATALPPGSCTRCGDTGFLRIEGRTENCPTCNR